MAREGISVPLCHSLPYSFEIRPLTEAGAGLGSESPSNPPVSVPHSGGVTDTGMAMLSFLDRSRNPNSGPHAHIVSTISH